jgi:hypothetical protein
MSVFKRKPAPVPKRIPPLPLLPELIRFELLIDGARRTVEVPKLHADRPVPFAPVLDMGMLHGARVTITRGVA